MTVGKEKYTELLDQFRAISEPYITHEIIQRLKEENKKKINSTRVFEKINDIKSLLYVLEKRGIVQYNDISVLKRIAKDFVKDKTVEELILKYEQWLEENSVNVNDYYLYSCAIVPKGDPGLQISMEPNQSSISHYMSNINVGITAQSSFGINQTQNTANTNVRVTSSAPVDAEKEIQDIVIRKISKKIGRFWKDVCRYLHFQEGEILEIEFDNSRTPRTFENMFKQALQMYFLEQHPNWRIDLMNALSQANRNDLRDTVLEILSQTSF